MVVRETSRVRRKRFVHGDGGKCKFVDAALKLPAPGDKMKGTFGQGLALVPDSAQLELFCPPCNPA
jgi:hypothetical protein